MTHWAIHTFELFLSEHAAKRNDAASDATSSAEAARTPAAGRKRDSSGATPGEVCRTDCVPAIHGITALHVCRVLPRLIFLLHAWSDFPSLQHPQAASMPRFNSKAYLATGQGQVVRAVHANTVMPAVLVTTNSDGTVISDVSAPSIPTTPRARPSGSVLSLCARVPLGFL